MHNTTHQLSMKRLQSMPKNEENPQSEETKKSSELGYDKYNY
jgi:hypothetical protein